MILRGFSGLLRLYCVICRQFGRDGRRLRGINGGAQGCNRAARLRGAIRSRPLRAGMAGGCAAQGWGHDGRRRTMGPGVAEKRRGLAGTGVWLLPYIFSALFLTHGYRKNWRQGLQNGGLKNIFRIKLGGTVSRCIHEILSIDGACNSCINGSRDDGLCECDQD